MGEWSFSSTKSLPRHFIKVFELHILPSHLPLLYNGLEAEMDQ